jgi:D-sedoheptulose 7-phosphate isomerase
VQNPRQFLAEYFEAYRQRLFEPSIHPLLIELFELMQARKAARGKVVFAGNGGSSAIASHCATDFSKNAGIRSVNFGDASLITCLANDYGYERWLEKACELYSDPDDLIVLISSSGKSPNVVRAADFVNARGNTLVTFTGFDENNPLKARGKLNLWVHSRAYNIVEMTHHIWLLAVCDMMIGKAEYPAS